MFAIKSSDNWNSSTDAELKKYLTPYNVSNGNYLVQYWYLKSVSFPFIGKYVENQWKICGESKENMWRINGKLNVWKKTQPTDFTLCRKCRNLIGSYVTYESLKKQKY